MPQCYNPDGTRNYECAIDHYVICGRDAVIPVIGSARFEIPKVVLACFTKWPIFSFLL